MENQRYDKKKEFYKVTTTDNFVLWMRRYKPRDEQNVSRNPVVLCHGLLANKHSLDFGEEGTDEWNNYSLAAFLYKGGKNNDVKFDVWVPELRGRRSYVEHNLELDMGKTGFNSDMRHWCFDDYVDKDVPAIIQTIKKTYVEEKNFPSKIFWVGMSMGGMLGYAHGETEQGSNDFKGVVTIGSPVAFEYNKANIIKFAKVIAPRRFYFNVNLRSVLEVNPKIMKSFIYQGSNPDNIDEKLLKRYVELGFDNTVSSKIISQFGVFFRHNDFCRFPRYPWAYDFFDKIPFVRKKLGVFSWKKNLFKFKNPLLALAGAADKEAPPEEVKYAVGHVSSKDITYYEFSRFSSFTDIDYGHLDFHLGPRVRDEVYPLIYEWLKKHSDKETLK